MDADTKAIMDAIMEDGDDPMGLLAANIGNNGLPPGVSLGCRRVRVNSNASDKSDDMDAILRKIAALEEQNSTREASSSTPSPENMTTNQEPAKEEPEKEVDEVIERVKRSRLEQHERDLLGCIIDTTQIANNFESVCLPDDIIDVLRSMVSLPLICPDEFQTGLLKQYTMSGALLFGPPGTGKTLFAQALAKESGARMIAVKPSDILHKCVGESERLVKALFSLARKLKPCVVFIDEIDALFGTRTNAGQQSSARWHTSMLTEFMQEIDGLMSSQVIVLGATNRPFDLDDAVLRRLPCRVMIDLPARDSRREILRILLREEALAEDVKLDLLAERTEKYSGSDLKNVCLAAAFNAVKENATLPWKTAAKTDPYNKGKAPAFPRPGRTLDSNNRFEEITDDSDKPEPSSGAKSPGSTRVIAQRHFERALSEIAPSTSETQASMNEIRTWNTKFGSGASRGLGLGAGAGGYVPGSGASGFGSAVPQTYVPGQGYPGHTPGQGGLGHSSSVAYKPGQGYTPGQGYPSGQGSTSGQNYTPGQGYTPGQAYTPGQGYTPVQGYTSVQGYAPVHSYTPGQGFNPSQGSASAQSYTPGQGYTPGQAYTPGKGASSVRDQPDPEVPPYVPGQGYNPTGRSPVTQYNTAGGGEGPFAGGDFGMGRPKHGSLSGMGGRMGRFGGFDGMGGSLTDLGNEFTSILGGKNAPVITDEMREMIAAELSGGQRSAGSTKE